MNDLVKLLTDDDGYGYTDDYWHLSIDKGGRQLLCTGEFFGYGESGCEFETRQVKKGGITCPNCLEQIKEIKAVKL